MPRKSSKKLSVVLPIYNEAKTIPVLFQRLKPVLDDLKLSYEVIFVDDGSQDTSLSCLEEIYSKNRSRVKVISLSRNFGQHTALISGMEFSEGEAVVLMDADLQDLPEEIPRLYKAYLAGADCVYTTRLERKDGWLKKASSRLFWKIMNIISGYEMQPNQGIQRIMSRRFIDALLSLPDRSIFIAGMSAWVGFQQDCIQVDHGKRHEGRSHYSLLKMFHLMWSAVTSFSTFPLQIASYLGIIMCGGSMLAAAYFVYLKLAFGMGITGWTSLVVSIFCIGGVQLLVLGVMGKYLANILSQTLSRPRYVVKTYLGASRSLSAAA